MARNPQEVPAATPQEAPVQTGLVVEAPALPAEPINLVMPEEVPKRFIMEVADDQPEVPPDFQPVATVAPIEPVAAQAAGPKLNARDAAEEAWKAEQDEKRTEFMKRYYAARAETAFPRVMTQPIAPAVAEQTKAEMAAGAALNHHHASLRGGRVNTPPVDVAGGAKMVPVFRPADYTQPPLKTVASEHAPTRTVRSL